MKKIIYIFILLSTISCDSQSQNKTDESALFETQWEYKIADGCIDIYNFKSDSSFTFFSCEMQDDFFGSYYFTNDTLVIIQEGSKYDEVLSEESIHRAEKKRYKTTINGDKLNHLSVDDWQNGKWVSSSFKFDDNYVFIKTK